MVFSPFIVFFELNHGLHVSHKFQNPIDALKDLVDTWSDFDGKICHLDVKIKVDCSFVSKKESLIDDIAC